LNISYTAPLARAWQRMVRQLFRPFALESWLVIGLAAFLAELGNPLAYTGGRYQTGLPGHGGWERIRERASEFLTPAHVIVALVLLLVVLVVAAVVVYLVLWVRTRARFVFLRQVASGRAEFRGPWSGYSRLGWSLFAWEALFGITWIVPLAIGAGAFGGVLLSAIRGEPPTWSVAGAIAGGLLVAATSLLIVAVDSLVQHFVVPLMYRHDETILAAWSRFRPLLLGNAGAFAAYLVFVFILWILVGLALMLFALMTCCLGGLLLAIPYVGTLLTLPVWIVARAYGPEFLAQFGPEWNTLATGPADPVA